RNAIRGCGQGARADNELRRGVSLEQLDLSRVQRLPDLVILEAVAFPLLRDGVVGCSMRIVAAQLHGLVRGRVRGLAHASEDTPREMLARSVDLHVYSRVV